MYFTEVSILITQSSTPILAFTQTIFQYNFFYIYDKYDIVYILFLLKEKKIIANTGKGELKNLLKNSIPVSRSDKPNFSFEHFYIPYQEGNTYI